jgi:glycine cleavage system H lipoate-binding protein
VGMAHGNSILSRNSKIVSINFNASGRRDLLDCVVSGKKKRGAVFLTPDSTLCRITLEDGSEHNLSSVVRGKLIEINPRLVANPNLLLSRHEDEGYLAILAPKLNEIDGMHASLLNQEGYAALLESRKKDASVVAPADL